MRGTLQGGLLEISEGLPWLAYSLSQLSSLWGCDPCVVGVFGVASLFIFG
jgi:hypothetical protein